MILRTSSSRSPKRSRRVRSSAAWPSVAVVWAPRSCANKIRGVRAALIHDHFSAGQGVGDDHMNIICLGGRTVGPSVAWELVQTFLAAEYSQAPRHLRRLSKVALLELQPTRTNR